MADIELVIKIPEQSYQLLKNEGVDWLGAEHILNAVANGTPLPKGHGKIGDLDVARGKIEEYQELIRNTSKLTPDKALDLILLGRCVELIDKVKPIIEADKAESEPQERGEV